MIINPRTPYSKEGHFLTEGFPEREIPSPSRGGSGGMGWDWGSIFC